MFFSLKFFPMAPHFNMCFVKKKKENTLYWDHAICLYVRDHVSETELFLLDCLEIQYRSSLQKVVRPVRVLLKSVQ
jgi:hypothetical protein